MPEPGEFHRAEEADERGEGICRTCLAPIWFEVGEVGHRVRKDPGWSDRIRRGGDSLVCFQAREYRHVPLSGREACIYDRAHARGQSLAEESRGPEHQDGLAALHAIVPGILAAHAYEGPDGYGEGSHGLCHCGWAFPIAEDTDELAVWAEHVAACISASPAGGGDRG